MNKTLEDHLLVCERFFSRLEDLFVGVGPVAAHYIIFKSVADNYATSFENEILIAVGILAVAGAELYAFNSVFNRVDGLRKKLVDKLLRGNYDAMSDFALKITTQVVGGSAAVLGYVAGGFADVPDGDKLHLLGLGYLAGVTVSMMWRHYYSRLQEGLEFPIGMEGN